MDVDLDHPVDDEAMTVDGSMHGIEADDDQAMTEHGDGSPPFDNEGDFEIQEARLDDDEYEQEQEDEVLMDAEIAADRVDDPSLIVESAEPSSIHPQEQASSTPPTVPAPAPVASTTGIPLDHAPTNSALHPPIDVPGTAETGGDAAPEIEHAEAVNEEDEYYSDQEHYEQGEYQEKEEQEMQGELEPQQEEHAQGVEYDHGAQVPVEGPADLDTAEPVDAATEEEAARATDHIQVYVAGQVQGDPSTDSEDGYYDDDGEEDDGEEDMGDDYPADVHSLPPIILRLPELGARALFHPLPDGGALPVWLSGRVEELGEASLSDVWAAIKGELVRENLAQSEEMIIVEKQMDLKMGEDDVNLQSITFLELLQVHHGCGLPYPVTLHVEFAPRRFITRFNAIQQELMARDDDDEHAGQDDDDEQYAEQDSDNGNYDDEGAVQVEQVKEPARVAQDQGHEHATETAEPIIHSKPMTSPEKSGSPVITKQKGDSATDPASATAEGAGAIQGSDENKDAEETENEETEEDAEEAAEGEAEVAKDAAVPSGAPDEDGAAQLKEANGQLSGDSKATLADAEDEVDSQTAVGEDEEFDAEGNEDDEENEAEGEFNVEWSHDQLEVGDEITTKHEQREYSHFDGTSGLETSDTEDHALEAVDEVGEEAVSDAGAEENAPVVQQDAKVVAASTSFPPASTSEASAGSVPDDPIQGDEQADEEEVGEDEDEDEDEDQDNDIDTESDGVSAFVERTVEEADDTADDPTTSDQIQIQPSAAPEYSESAETTEGQLDSVPDGDTVDTTTATIDGVASSESYPDSVSDLDPLSVESYGKRPLSLDDEDQDAEIATKRSRGDGIV